MNRSETISEREADAMDRALALAETVRGHAVAQRLEGQGHGISLIRRGRRRAR